MGSRVRGHLNAQFILAREFGREMLARGSGKIIFIASLMSFQGGIRVPAYAASKGAIARLTQALSNEWAGQGVQVNAIAPGYVATDLTADLLNDEARHQAILGRIPAGVGPNRMTFVAPRFFSHPPLQIM